MMKCLVVYLTSLKKVEPDLSLTVFVPTAVERLVQSHGDGLAMLCFDHQNALHIVNKRGCWWCCMVGDSCSSVAKSMHHLSPLSFVHFVDGNS